MASLTIPDLSFLNKTSNKVSNKNKKYNSTLGMITSFFTILLVFILLKINVIWVSLTLVLLAFIAILRHALSKKKSLRPAVIFLTVGLIIMSWQYIAKQYNSRFHNKVKNIEPFYTLFKPYQPYPGQQSFVNNINKVALSNTTSDLLKARVKPLSLGYHHTDQVITKWLAKLILSRSKILNVQLSSSWKYERLCHLVNKNILNTALVPAPIIHRSFMGYTEGFKETTNLQFLGNVQHQYLFCIANIKSGIQNIHQLNRRKVGMPLRLKSTWLDIEHSIFASGHDIKFTIADDHLLYQDLKDFKIDVMFHAGEYPNAFINDIINDISVSSSHSYQLIPIMLQNEKEFLRKNMYYRKNILKLTYDFLPSRYLPTGLGRTWQTNYTHEFVTLGFDLAMICNNKLDNFTGYEIAKTIFLGRRILIQQTRKNPNVFTGDPFTAADITNPSLPILPVQKGAKYFYINNGLIGYCKDPICLTTVGNKRCTVCDNNKDI